MKYAVAAVIQDNDKVLLCQRSQKASNQQLKWENPGGKVDEGETPENAIIREIKEELGVLFKIKKVIYEDSFISEDDTYNVIIYSGSITGVPKAMIPEETSKVKWFKLSELSKVDLASYTREDFKRFGWIK